MNNLRIVTTIFLSLVSLNLMAETISCENVPITSLYAQGDRDDGFVFHNKFVIEFAGGCGGKTWAHFDLSNPAASSFISTALSAKAMGKNVIIGVNTSNQTNLSNQLAYIGYR